MVPSSNSERLDPIIQARRVSLCFDQSPRALIEACRIIHQTIEELSIVDSGHFKTELARLRILPPGDGAIGPAGPRSCPCCAK